MYHMQVPWINHYSDHQNHQSKVALECNKFSSLNFFFIFTVEYINCKVSSGRNVRTIGLPVTLCMQYVSQNLLVYIHILNYILVLGEMNDRNMKVRNQIHTCMYSHQNWSNLLCKLTLSIISLLSVTSNYCNTNKHSLQFNPMQSNPADLFIKVSVLFLCSTFETTL